MSHLYSAKELKNKYPEATKGFTVFEVERIWEEYSEQVSAGWLIEKDEEEVKRVFDSFRTD